MRKRKAMNREIRVVLDFVWEEEVRNLDSLVGYKGFRYKGVSSRGK